MLTITPRTKDRITDALIISAVILGYIVFFAVFLVVTFLTNAPALTIPLFGIVGAGATAWFVSRIDN